MVLELQPNKACCLLMLTLIFLKCISKENKWLLAETKTVHNNTVLIWEMDLSFQQSSILQLRSTISKSELVSLFLESYSHLLPHFEEIQKAGERLKKKKRRSSSLLKTLIYPFDSTLFLLHTYYAGGLYVLCYIICNIYSYRWFLTR